jgi:hypothetical protein
MINFAQLFCTVADLVADKDSPGLKETRMFQAIKDASDFVQKDVGWFVPATLTRLLHGSGSSVLFVPPLLSVTSISNYAHTINPTVLTTDDYLLRPDQGFWPRGPYTQIIFKPYARQRTWAPYRNGVQIAGQWGMYDHSGATGATVQDTSGQNASQETLIVSDGGKVSPGMVLKIGDEQEAVTGWDAPTETVTALNGVISASDEVITVDDGSLINIDEVLRLTFEQMKVRDKRSNQLSVIRNWNGTGKVAHADDTPVDVYRTVQVERGVNGTDAAIHAKNTAISRYFVPDDILYLTKEIATLSANKALGGYQGRTGNQETGVVFYNDAFPQFDIEKVKSNYYIPRNW